MRPGMKVNTSSLRQALPRLPRVDTRKVCVAATRPHPARISQKVEGRSTVDHDHHKVPNTYEGAQRKKCRQVGEGTVIHLQGETMQDDHLQGGAVRNDHH